MTTEKRTLETNALLPKEVDGKPKQWTTTHMIVFAVVCAVLVGLVVGLISNADRLGSEGKNTKGFDDFDVPDECTRGVYVPDSSDESSDDVDSGDDTSYFKLGYGKHAEQQWVEYYPQCGCVSSQSPIDIDSDDALLHTPALLCGDEFLWQINEDYGEFMNGTYTVSNNGKSVVITPWARSKEPMATLVNRFQPVNSSSHSSFVLDSVHFHWPSEHTFGGDAYPLVAHFVHYSSDYPDLASAVADWRNLYKRGEDRFVLAVVAVFYDFAEEESRDSTDPIEEIELNEAFEELVATGVLSTAGASAIVTEFELDDLVPEERESFYFYEGSLTTPGCQPIVRWNIIADPLELPPVQLRAFLSNVKQARQYNARMVQPNTAALYGCDRD